MVANTRQKGQAMNTSIRKIAKWPSGLKLRKTLKNHAGWIGRIAWSPDGAFIASGSDDRTICVWNPATGELVRKIEGHNDTVFSVAWSHDGWLLASSSDDETVIIWNPATGQHVQKLTGHSSGVVHIAWLPDDKNVVTGGGDKTIRIWDVRSGETVGTLEGHSGWIRQLSLSPNGDKLVSASYDGTVRLWDLTKKTCIAVLKGHEDRVHSAIWLPDANLIASGSADFSIRVWDSNGEFLRKVDGHTAAVYDLAFSPDARLLASKSLDNTFKIWRTDDWTCVASLPEESVATDFGGLAFHPEQSILATLGDYDTVIRIWDIDQSKLLSASQETAFYTSAKVVLVGESNVGKSCLALRLAEDRYEEQATTHGMRFWVLSPQQLNAATGTPEDEHRDIVLWDMGGQDEYRLIHQIFFHDTTVALMLFDPTRGRTAIEEVEGWNRRLEKQLHGRRAIKLLVGTKVDNRGTTVDRALIDRLVTDCGFAAYYPVSSKVGTGMAEFRKALSEAIDWTVLMKTAGPEVFHQVYSEVERARAGGEAVLSVSDLMNRLVKDGASVSQEALDAGLDQLALQGVIASTTLASGDRALVLRIDEVERYAGSVILAARENPRGIPAIEERSISSSRMKFPRIEDADRLPWVQERATLECVVQLLIEHDICLRHEGLLVFPSLFLPTESGEDSGPRGVALHYDFTGAIDNIYASLVAKLSLSNRFGRYRLWENRAEWEMPDQGTCGVRRVSYKSGMGRIELYFSNLVDSKRRELFLVFVEDHLRHYGVEITENIEITCECGHPFQDDAVRARLAAGHLDILCSVCETRNRISAGARKIRAADPNVEKSLIGLKTVIEKRRRVDVEKALKVFGNEESITGPVRILHLSDLHMSKNKDLDPEDMFQNLLADLRLHRDLGFESLDYLFVTGDLTTCAAPEEFEKAHQLISRVIDAFRLNAARCVIVPGNHDVDWNEPVYEWKSNRQVDQKTLEVGTYVPQGNGFLIRNDDLYPRRFKNFSDRFYMFLRQEEYPLEFENQAIPFFFAESNIQLLALNSCWEIDEFFPERASIYGRALANGLLAADRQLEKARQNNGATKSEVLRFAIWHHPVTGNEKIRDDAFLSRLSRAGFKLCLHGHVHEERADLIGYTDPASQMYVAGAGSFGAPATQRPENVPRLYNILEIANDRSQIKVHTRWLPKSNAAWDGWAVWGPSPQERLTYYTITISGNVAPVRLRD
jgi:small GTP-binding protein